MTAGIDPRSWGVAEGFHDVQGHWREAPQGTVEVILASMDARPGDPPPPRAVTLRTDHPLPSLLPGTIVCEDGAEIDIEAALPPDLPTGYHRFVASGAPPPDAPAGTGGAPPWLSEAGPDVPLIVSPGRVPYPAGRQWGFAAQLYATRSRRSWGMGDLADLRELCRWSAGLGAGFTLVNPLHAATPARPVPASPYYPGSRCFLNPLYIAVEDVPGARDLDGLVAAAGAARALNGERIIDRDRVWDLKGPLLEQLFERSVGDPGFAAFVRDRGEPLETFATFCALAETHGADWRRWPEGLRHPSGASVAGFSRSGPGRSRVLYHSWLQWILDGQVAAAHGELGLVADLAVGVDPGGPDAWSWQDSFSAGMRVGAPPDEFNTLGQDWGLPPFDPWRLRSAGYRPWIEALRAGLRHAAGLRVDHVMGLFRLFWIPDGMEAPRGAYVRYPHHDMLNVLALEAERAGAFVVGEDLGTVEDEVRRDLAERRVLSYRVWWFEAERPSEWPEAAMGAVTTHDLPTVAGVLAGSDLEAQRHLGMDPNEESSEGLRRKLVERAGGADPGETIAGVYHDLAGAPCVLLTASLDDVLEVEERPNMPGTTDTWPNWSLALPSPLEVLEAAPLARRIARDLGREE